MSNKITPDGQCMPDVIGGVVGGTEYTDFLLRHLQTEGLASWASEAIADHLRFLMQQRDEHLAEAEQNPVPTRDVRARLIEELS